MLHRVANRSIKDITTVKSTAWDEDESLPAFTSAFNDDDVDVDVSHSFLGSPMSQIWSEDDEEKNSWYPGSYSRKENWLEEASQDVLNLEKLPLGSLTEEDVESITGLMAAWVRRRSLEAAMSVEKLLKRVVDDMRGGNTEVHVTTRMYTIVRWTKGAFKPIAN